MSGFALDTGSHLAGFGYNSASYELWKQAAQEQENLLTKAMDDGVSLWKALETSSGIVAQGETGGAALREQFLDPLLREISFDDAEAVALKMFGIENISSTTFEWTNMGFVGGAGDGFTNELGDDGDGNVTVAETNFLRELALIKYMATQRNVSVPATRVKGVSKPERAQMIDATHELFMKANLATYFGSALTHNRQFNGIEAQLLRWVTENPSDQAILYDAGGEHLGNDALQEIAGVRRKKFAKGGKLIQSVDSYGDTEKSLFPQTRGGFGESTAMGGDHSTFKSKFGNIIRVEDAMLRANRPLVVDGPGSDGIPRTADDVPANALSFATTPFTTVPAAAAAGAGNWWQTGNVNTDTAILGTAPALPSGAGNQSNHLAAGTYYVAVAPVYLGREGLPWVYGNAAVPGSIGTPTGVTVTLGQLIKVDIAVGSITGLGSTYARRDTKFRVYISSTLPASWSDFKLLGEAGCPTSGNVRLYHNGSVIPGTDTAFLVDPRTIKMLQLLPLTKVPLPRNALMLKFAMLWFLSLCVFIPRKNMVIRNIGRYTAE